MFVIQATEELKAELEAADSKQQEAESQLQVRLPDAVSPALSYLITHVELPTSKRHDAASLHGCSGYRMCGALWHRLCAIECHGDHRRVCVAPLLDCEVAKVTCDILCALCLQELEAARGTANDYVSRLEAELDAAEAARQAAAAELEVRIDSQMKSMLPSSSLSTGATLLHPLYPTGGRR